MSADAPATTTPPVLTVTWDTVIGARHVGYDPETGPEAEPISLGEMVVSTIAAQLMKEIRRDVRAEVIAAVQPAIAAEVADVVREALAGEIRRTNTWGEPKGEPQTVRTMVADEVKAYLSEPDRMNRYGERERKGGFRELLRVEVHDALAKDLAGAIREARASVAHQVRDRAAEILGSIVETR